MNSDGGYRPAEPLRARAGDAPCAGHRGNTIISMTYKGTFPERQDLGPCCAASTQEIRTQARRGWPRSGPGKPGTGIAVARAERREILPPDLRRETGLDGGQAGLYGGRSPEMSVDPVEGSRHDASTSAPRRHEQRRPGLRDRRQERPARPGLGLCHAAIWPEAATHGQRIEPEGLSLRSDRFASPPALPHGKLAPERPGLRRGGGPKFGADFSLEYHFDYHRYR